MLCARGIVMPLVFTPFTVVVASAQAPAKVALTIQWGPVFYDRPAGTGGSPKGTRVSGSIDVRLGSDWSTGVWVTSWSRGVEIRKDGAITLSDRAEAALTTIFVRRQLHMGRGRVFARAGMGVAWTETMTGGVGTILLQRRNRPVVAAGLGTLIALQQPLFAVISVDHARILGARPNSRELRYGTGLAIGLMVR